MSPFIERLGWVLIHSLWQLAVMAAVAFVIQRAMQRTSAAARYAVLLAMLGLVVAAPLVTWSVLPTQAALLVAERPDIRSVPAPAPTPKVEAVAPAVAPSPVIVPSTPPTAPATPAPLEPSLRVKLPEPVHPSWSEWVQRVITPWLSTIVWGWSLGVLAFAIRPLWSWFTVRQLRTQGVFPVPESVQAALANTAHRLGMTQAVRVLQSTIVQVPIVAGYLKPVILLPASIVTGLPTSQLEAILAHELAHIRRHDYLVNLLQTLVETVFFYHPAVWWLSHQIRCERENCCDDIAVAMLGNRLDYSRALLAVEELRGTPTTLAVGASGGSLLGRVKRLFHREADERSLSNGSVVLSVALGVALLAVVTMANSSRVNPDDYRPGAKVDIPGYGALEVVAIRNHAGEWWQPDGTSLPADFGEGVSGSLNFRDEASSGRQVGILTRYAGMKALQYSRLRLEAPRTGSFGAWSSDTSGKQNQKYFTEIRFHSDHLAETAESGDLTVLLSFDSWSPWQTIDLLSPEKSQNDGPLSITVGEIPPSLMSSQCELGLKFKDEARPAIHFEQMALDQNGNEIPSRGVVGNGGLGLVAYAVPASQVAQLRYRVLRFTHEVHVRKLPLRNAQPTESAIRLKVLLDPDEVASPDYSGPVATPQTWPQLGGSATHNPASSVANLPTQFDLTKKENIRWSQPIGDFAFSSPVVSGGKVLIGTNNAIGRDPQFPASIDRACLQCFDERTGEFLWQYSSPKMEQGRRHDWPSIGICSTPVIEGDRVWFATNRCEIVCLDLNGHRDNEDDGEPEVSASGEPGAANTLTPSPTPGGRGEKEQQADVVWKYDMFNTLGVRPLNATCVTPVIAGDLLLVNSSNDVDESYQKLDAPETPAFLAFHKANGQLIWSDKTPNPNILGSGCSMGAPAVAKIDGVWQAIFAGYDGWLYAFDLESIQRSETLLLWKFDLNPKESQYRLSGPRNEFSYRGLPSTPVVVGNHVFAAVGHNPERGEGLGRLWCIDATKRGDLSSDLVYNKSAPDVVIPHKRVQACEPDKGDFTRPNPNSGVEWVYTTDDLNKNGQIEFEEQMHLSNSLPAIHDGLLLTTDLSGLVHCLDVTTGELLWSHDQLATCWSGPLLADGKAWVIDEDGDLSIFALSRQKQLLAEIAMNSPGYTNFAAANQTLYVATKTQLVAIGSGEFPKPDGVTARLPGGLEIELVGVTPNAAPTSEGWRVDGSLIEGAGNWPRGATFSNDGDRFTITTDGASKLPPNPLARDLLFESRGLRSHPAWVILNQKGWTQFESVNADETIRRRLGYLPKESGQPLTVEMALTDSPWGPWQRIDKSGKRINTIKTFEPDQKLYDDIQIVRLSASRDTDSNDKPLHLVLVEPATHDDYQSGVFDIEVRFVDKNGKVWKTYARPAPPKDGRRLVTWATGGPVPLESLAYAEFRLRPYRHFITFKNVPLDRTPGAQVAVEHRSLPLPPTHTPDPRFTAQVPGGVEIELLRIVRNDLSEDQSWTPDGMPSLGRLDWPQRSHYKVRPDGNGYSSSDEGPGSDRAWDFAYEVRSAGPKPFVSVDVVGEGSTSSSQVLPAIGPRLVTVIPKDPESLTAFQLRVGTEAWGEWIQVGADGEILNPKAVRTENDAPDRLVSLVRAGLDTENLDRSWLQWRTPQNHAQHYQMEVRAIDDDGKVTESNSSTHSVTDRTHIGITKYFNLPLDRLARFEYRLRPYRHLVTFDQICTDPAKPTEVRVDVSPIVYLEVFPSPEAAVNPTRPMVAKLPGGLEVELVGVTKNFAPAKEGWKPNGSRIGEVADWQATRVFRRVGDSTVFDSKGTSHPDARDYLFEIRGFRSPPSYETNLNDTTSWNEPEYAEPYRTRLSMLLKESNDAKKFSVKITDDPWGPYQQVGPDGALLNELNLTELEKKYYDKIRVEHCGPDPANPGEGELSLQFQESFILDEKDWGYDFEVRAIGLDGQPLKDAYPWSSSGILNTSTLQYLTSDHLPANKIARWEYRLRPYRHFITFENVSFEPGKKTEPKISVKSIPEATATTSLLELRNPDNTLWQSSLVAGHIGFIPPNSKAWNAWVGKDKQVDLSALPAGKHWLISRFPWSVIPVETPLQQPLRLPLRLGTPPKQHSSSNYSANLSVQRDEQGREFIHCDFSNNTDELWSFSELDLTLEAGWFTTESHGHSPRWLGGTLTQVPQIEIAPGQKGSLRIDWSEWAKRGVWDPMSGPQAVSKPVLPDQQPGKIWVRISGPGFGANSVAVMHPDKLLAVGDEPVPQPPAADELDGPRIDLIGLTYDSVPKQETWNTNGQPLLAPEWVQQLPKLYGDDKSQPAPLYLFEVHGLRAKPSFRHRYQPAVVSGDDEVPEGRPYRMAVLYEDLKPEERNQFIVWGEHPAVRITDEPWGPWRTITKQGQFAGELDSATLYREGYELLAAHGIRPLTKQKNDPKPTAGSAQSALVLTYPRDYDSFYAIELEGVSSDSAQPNVRLTNRITASFQTEQKNGWFVVDECPVDLAQLDHIRFRIRPYRHRFEFQEVADKPNAKTPTSAPFRVIYRKVEHDLPKLVRPAQAQSQKISLPRLPIESYARAGVLRDKLAEVDKKRLASAPLGDVQEPPENERGNGPLVLGLRIGSDADWWIGGQVKCELTVRNTSAENVLFQRASRSDFGLSVVAIDSQGKEHPADFAHFEGWPALSPVLLPPGHIMTVKEFTLRFDAQTDGYYPGLLPLPPGGYTLKCRWHDARPEVAHEGEWTGELTSVTHRFQLAAADAPAAQRPEAMPPRVELVGLTMDRAPKSYAWQPNGSPMTLPEWAESIPELAPEEKKGPGAAMFLLEFQGLTGKPSVYFHETVGYQSGEESPREDGSWRRAILYADALQGIPKWGSPPTLSLSDEPWGPWRTVTTGGQLVPPVDGDRTYRSGYRQITFHGVRPLQASPQSNDPLPPNSPPLGVVQHQPQGFRNQYAIEVEGALKGGGTQPLRYEPITPRFFERFAYDNRWNYKLDWPLDPDKYGHLRFRIRPYRHQFTFENVNFAPSQNPANYSPFKTVYKKLEHDLPKPVAAIKQPEPQDRPRLHAKGEAEARAELERLATTDPGHIHATRRATANPNGWKWSVYLPPGKTWRLYCESGMIPQWQAIQPTAETTSFPIHRKDEQRIIELEAYVSPDTSDDGKLKLWIEADRSFLQGLDVAVWRIAPQVADYITGRTEKSGTIDLNLDIGGVNTLNAGRNQFRRVLTHRRFREAKDKGNVEPELMPGFCVWIQADPDDSKEPVVNQAAPNPKALLLWTQQLSDPDQAVRDQAAAQLKKHFRPSAKEPWQAKIDAIAKDTPRAEVCTKLGIDEKQDLYAAINNTEDCRLDDTWIVRITFTGDLQRSVALELIELLHRPWVAPPADFTGTWVTYYVNGVKAHEIDYRNGKYHGRYRSYYSNGNLLVQQHYTDQVANGEDTGYYATGQLMYRGLYENDKQVGPWIHYNEDGSERSRTVHPQPIGPPQEEPRAAAHPPIILQVVDAVTNQPISGAVVVVRQTISSWQPVQPESTPNLSTAVPESLQRQETDAAGRFEITIPAAMRDWQSDLQVSVRHPGYVIEQSFGAWQVTAEMAADPQLAQRKLFSGGVIKLKRGDEVSGLVTDALDQPVAGVRVYAAMQLPEYLNMPPHAVTDTQGRYKFRVSGHDGYRLMFVPAIRDTSAAAADKLRDLAAMAQIDLIAQSIPIRKQYGEHPVVKLVSGTRIVGVVRDSAGQPLPNIIVQANGSDSVYMGFPEIMSRAVTDAAGRYELPAQKIPVDVRIARHNGLGGWSEPTAISAEVYMPEFVTERWRLQRAGDANVYEVDFAPVKSVTLRARAYNAKGLPDTAADIELTASVPVPGAGPEQRLPKWRRTFTAVSGEAGLYGLKAPLGLLEARIDLTGEGLRQPAVDKWTRAVREGEKLEGPRTNSGWEVLDRDDDSIVVGTPAKATSADP